MTLTFYLLGLISFIVSGKSVRVCACFDTKALFYKCLTNIC